MSKFAKILLYTLLGLCALVVILFYVQNSSGVFGLDNLKWVMSNLSMVDGLIWCTYLLSFVSILLVIIMSIYTMAINPKSIKKAGITLLIALVVIGISYLFASGNEVTVNVTTPPSKATFKLTDTGLLITYILAAVSVLALIFGGIRKIIQNR